MWRTEPKTPDEAIKGPAFTLLQAGFLSAMEPLPFLTPAVRSLTGELPWKPPPGPPQQPFLTQCIDLPAFGGGGSSSSLPPLPLTIPDGGTGQTTKTEAFDALCPLTTKGDLVGHNGTDNVRIPVGANDKPVIADSTQSAGLKYATLTIAGGGTGQVTQTAAFDALSPNTTKGDISVRGTTNNVRLPVGTDGQALIARAAATNGVQWETVSVPSDWTTVDKTVDQTKISDAVLAVDDELFFTMLADRYYEIDADIFFDSDVTPDFKWRHAGPTATTVRIHRSTMGPGDTSEGNIKVDTAYSAADVVVTCSSTLGGYVKMRGFVLNGKSSGDFQFKWAQNTSDKASTKVLAGSRIRYRLIP